LLFHSSTASVHTVYACIISPQEEIDATLDKISVERLLAILENLHDIAYVRFQPDDLPKDQESHNSHLIQNDSIAGIYEANKQGAFVFWNHPHWTSKSEGRMDGIAKLDPVHKKLIKENLLHGLEVANELTFSEEALEIALDNNLTILGTSDIHGIADWLFNIPAGGHRPLTYIISKDFIKSFPPTGQKKPSIVLAFTKQVINKEIF
jgi:hypothetical protein